MAPYYNNDAIPTLIQIQGKATTVAELDSMLKSAGLRGFAVSRGVYPGMVAVVTLYKGAAGIRQVVDGVNTNPDSVEIFGQCAQTLIGIAEGLPDGPFKAWMLHDAASSLARHNGNNVMHQNLLNRTSVRILQGYDTMEQGTASQDPDWQAVFCKAAVGLYEANEEEFQENGYRKVIEIMALQNAKDLAGRVTYLAEWLLKQGRRQEAIELINQYQDKMDGSAPNQQARYVTLRQKLGLSVLMFVIGLMQVLQRALPGIIF